MITVNKKQVATTDGKFVAEASSLGIPPGVVPDFIKVVDDNNNGYVFSTPITHYHRQEVTDWVYKNNTGLTLTVLND